MVGFRSSPVLSRDHSVSSKTATVVGVTPQWGQPVHLGGEDQPRPALHTPHACAQGHSESKGPRGHFDPVQPGAVAQATLCGAPEQISGQFRRRAWAGEAGGKAWAPAWTLGSPSHSMTTEGSQACCPRRVSSVGGSPGRWGAPGPRTRDSLRHQRRARALPAF